MSKCLPILKQIEHILVVRAGGLGDLILTLPAIRALRRRFPDAQLEVMGHPWTLEIARGTYADRVSSVDDHPGMERLFVRGARLTDEIAGYLSGFDLILWYGYDSDGVLSDHLRRANCGRVLVVDPFPPEGKGIHAGDHLLSALRPFGISAEDVRPEVRVSGPDRDAAARRLREFRNSELETRNPKPKAESSSLLTVHPGSGSPAKNWAPDRFAAFIRQMVDRHDMRVLLLSGPADEEAVHEVRRRIEGIEVLLLDTLPLRVLAAMLAECALFLGNDSGVTHLAAAVGAPTVAVFGPTDPRMWAPRGERVLVVRKEGLSCSPCTRERSRACPDRRCLDAVEVRDVVRVADRIRHRSV